MTVYCKRQVYSLPLTEICHQDEIQLAVLNLQLIPVVALCKNVRVYEIFVLLICRHICETPVTEQTFIEQLHELHHKIDFAKEQSFKGALSVNDVGDVLEKLKVKVTSGMDHLVDVSFQENVQRNGE